jgi:arylsulfatase A-like enzyme
MSIAKLNAPPGTHSPTPTGVGARWSRLRFGPNTFVMALAVCGCTTEVALLRTAADSLFTLSAVECGICVGVLAWFWLTAAWGFVWIVSGTRELARRVPRPLAWGLWGVLTLGLMLTAVSYAASWGLYFRVGRFSNLESVIFGIENASTGWFWEYLKQAESKYIWLLTGFFAVCLLVVPLVVRLALHAQARERVQAFPRFLLWGAAGVGLVVFNNLLLPIGPAPQSNQRDQFVDTVKNRVNPAITLGSSLVDLLFEEPIEPCLDLSQLRPISNDDYPRANGRELPSVIIVAIESLRSDVVHARHQGREVMPNLNALARGGIHCTRAYTQSTHSDYADPCIPSSLYPLRSRRHHFYRSNDPWPKTHIYDVLAKTGHAAAIISSQNESWGGMDQFLKSSNLDLFYDAQRSDHKAAADDGVSARHHKRLAKDIELAKGKLTDQHTADTAIAWISKQVEADKPFCLCMNFQSSHFPYYLPPDREQPFQPCAIDFDASFLHYPQDKVDVVRNAYFNSLYECDKQLGRVVAALSAQGRLENTILVVVGENGEAFWENGMLTHAREPVEPTVRVACVLHAPKLLQPRIEDYPVELIDVAPTVCGLMGLPPHPNFQGIDILAKDRGPADERLMFVHVENGLSRGEAVILGARWKLTVDRLRGGRATLFDVVNDPGETIDLAQTKPELARQLRELVTIWRRNQLAYYHFPQYYQNYYPPRAPRWQGPLPR